MWPVFCFFIAIRQAISKSLVAYYQKCESHPVITLIELDCSVVDFMNACLGKKKDCV